MELPTSKQNFSKKRQAILEVLQHTTSHPTAEWVHQQVKLQYPSISLGTVYRNLTQLKEDGQIHCVGVVDGHERLDARCDPHGHFQCRVCGSVSDVELDALPAKVKARLEQQNAVAIESWELMLYGVCKHCIEKRSALL